MNTTRLAALFIAASTSLAQVPDAAPAPAPAPAPTQTSPFGGGGSAPVGQAAPQNGGQAKPAPGSPFGKDIPLFDPGTNTVAFDGRHYNITNNQIFHARFDKYLNAPEATAQEDVQYRWVIDRILSLLAPGNATQANVDAAFKLLPMGSRYDIDSRLCDSLADAVYAVWQAQRNQNRLAAANAALEDEARQISQNLQIMTADRNLTPAPAAPGPVRGNGGGGGGGQRRGGGAGGGGGAPAAAPGQVNPANSSDYQTSDYTRRYLERLQAIKANQVKRELSELEAKVGFHTLMVQFLAQRRFQHVLMATRFYRALFTDGDSKLNLGKDMTEAIQRSAGMPPTVSVIDSLANEAMRDVREGIKAFDYLLLQNEMKGATERLQEAFVVGEYMPEVRLVPREKKRQCLEFAQKGYQLITAIDVRDYGRAEQLVTEMKKVAKDFDGIAPMAQIDGVRLQARALLVKARQAAINNNQAEVEKAMAEAGALWPGNPEFKEASEKLYTNSDTVQRTLNAFDEFVRQRNWRAILADNERFVGAIGLDNNEERKTTLRKVVNDMKAIEAAIQQATVRSQQNDNAGAWEVLEKTAKEYPDDPVLNQQRAEMTTYASEFVKCIRTAEELKKRGQYGSSLAHYLKAQKLSPHSTFAKDGIDQMVKAMVPET